MSAEIELVTGFTETRIALDADRMTIGKASEEICPDECGDEGRRAHRTAADPRDLSTRKTLSEQG